MTRAEAVERTIPGSRGKISAMVGIMYSPLSDTHIRQTNSKMYYVIGLDLVSEFCLRDVLRTCWRRHDV